MKAVKSYQKLSKALIVLSLWLASCSSETVDPVSSPPDSADRSSDVVSTSPLAKLRVVDGRLVLPDDRAHYEELVMFFHHSQNRPGAWEEAMNAASLEGFTSLLDAYRAVPEAAFEQMAERASVEGYEHFFFLELEDPSTREMEIEQHVSNPLFLRLLNAHSIMQVGDRVYRYFRGYKVIMEAPSEAQLEQLKQLKWQEPLPEGAEKLDILRNDRPASVQATRVSYECKPVYASSPKRRIKATLHDDSETAFCIPLVGCSYNIYYYIEVKNQRRKFGIWWARGTDRIRVSGTRTANDPAITADWGGSSFYLTQVLSSKPSSASWQLGVYFAQAGQTAPGPTSFTTDNLIQDVMSPAEGTCNVAGSF